MQRLIDLENFPEGRWLSPNCRAWTEDEIAAWLASRPVGSDGVKRRKPKLEDEAGTSEEAA
jgi:hypothetical protein